MSNMRDYFPPMPDCRGEWVPIYMEPVMGSGEKITIAIAADSNNGAKVVRALHEDVISCLYGHKNEHFLSQVEWIVDSFESHLRAGGRLSNWQPPLSGFVPGNSREAASSTIDGIIKQGMQMTASLNRLALTAEHEEDDEPKTVSDEFAKKIKEGVISEYPHLEHFFNKKVKKVYGKDLTTTYNLITQSYAANFKSIQPTSIQQGMNAAKVKIYDLHALKQTLADALPDSMSYELILGLPSLQATDIPDSTHKKIAEYKEGLFETADKMEVRVFDVDKIDSAVARVISRAA